MTLGELRELLNKIDAPDTAPVVMSQDPEGNGYYVLDEAVMELTKIGGDPLLTETVLLWPGAFLHDDIWP